MWPFRTRFFLVALSAFLLASAVDHAWAGAGQNVLTTQALSVTNGTYEGSNYEKGQHDGRSGIDDRDIESDYECGERHNSDEGSNYEKGQHDGRSGIDDRDIESDYDRGESHDSDKHLRKPDGCISVISLNPSSVTGGSSSTGTVTLTSPAPAGGAAVTLSSNSAAATVPASVTVGAGSTTGTFMVSTSAVGATTSAAISGNYNGSKSATLTINSPVLSMISLNPNSVTGGNASAGTAILTGPAPPGGAVVALSGVSPIVAGIQGVHSPVDLPQDGSIDWTNLGPAFFSMPSGSLMPVTGLPSLSMTLSTATGLPMETLTNCAAGQNCGWWGNFAEGAGLLWISGTYEGSTGWWAPNGPLTISFNSPQRGLGFQIMADEAGPFTATVCAYSSTNTLLGCVPFSGNGSGVADGSAIFIGLYDDAAEISRITIDAGGALYLHDFAIGQVQVASTQRQIVPTSITVPAGATGATFPVSTSAVNNSTVVSVTGSYVMTRSASLSIDPPVLSAISLNPASVTGGASSTGTATLNGAAPVGGVVVTLSADDPVSTGIQTVTATTGLPQDGSVTWADLGPSFTSLPSGTVVPITGLSESTVAITTANGLSTMIITNCPARANCWSGNFVAAAPLLWVGGNYDALGNWAGNGPLTLTLNTPQRGMGFNVMADEAGPFTATVCAYSSTNTLLGCVPFSGNGSGVADGSAIFIGLYDDAAEISRITIDAGGALYPHDFAIGQVHVASTRRQFVPTTVTIPPGATSGAFAVTTNSVNTSTSVNISGSYSDSRTATLNVDP
jgi:hypothetical protein